MNFARKIIRWSSFAMCQVSIAVMARAQGVDSAHVSLAGDTASTFRHPQGIVLGFDHVLSIYEWRGAFDYTAGSHSWQPPTWIAPLSDVHLRATSRFLPQDSLATTEALGTITGSQPLAPYQPGTASLAPFVTFFGSS